jgi:cell division protein FtsQ
MDPRIRQRRVDVQRQEGRRRLWFLVVAASVLAAAAAAVGATRTSLLDVDTVEVRGATHTPRSALLGAGGLERQPLMDVDETRVSRRVEALPWVLQARTSRRWPGTVVIDVTERTPAAVVRGGSGWAVVDVTGRVLEVGAARPPDLPALNGAPVPGGPGTTIADSGAGSAGAESPGAESPGAESLSVVAALPPALRARVREIVIAPGGEVSLQLTPPGGEIRLGRPDNLETKLTSALTVLEKANVARLAVLDVRVPTAPVLTRR